MNSGIGNSGIWLQSLDLAPVHLNSIFRCNFLAGAGAALMSPLVKADPVGLQTWALLSDTHIDADPFKCWIPVIPSTGKPRSWLGGLAGWVWLDGAIEFFEVLA